MYSAVRTGSVENVVFVGGSNANNLALAAAALGVDTYKHAQGGWKVTKDSVDKLIPDLKESLSAVPPDTPVVFFCLDNSSFMALNEDGNIAVISRCIEGDDGFHVVGELVVAPERALNHVHTQLKRAIEACGDHPVFIISPWPRFIRTPCCSDAAHVTNFSNSDFLATILSDLNKHKSALRRAVPAATIIDGLELISGTGYNTEKAAAVINSGWAFDPVHPSKHVYAKMALNLLEKIAPQNQHKPEDRKRSWSVSNPGSGGGGGGASGSGCSSRSGGQPGAGNSGGGGRQTPRSQQWKEGGRRDSFRSTHSTSSEDGSSYNRQQYDGRSYRGRGGGDRGGGYQNYGQNRGGFGFGGGRGGRGGRGGAGYGGRY
jgi:uncharacterized membrane protein YgcG